MTPRDTSNGLGDIEAAAQLAGVTIQYAEPDEYDMPVNTAPEEDAVDVWPDAADPLRLFCALMTQWRMGPSGPTGLDYAVVPMVATEIVGIRKRKLQDLWPLLQVMESEALAVISEQAKEAMK